MVTQEDEKKKEKEKGKHIRKVVKWRTCFMLSFISVYCCYFWKILSVRNDKHNPCDCWKINHTFKWRQMPYPLGAAPGCSHNGFSLLLSPSLLLVSKVGSSPVNVHPYQPWAQNLAPSKQGRYSSYEIYSHMLRSSRGPRGPESAAQLQSWTNKEKPSSLTFLTTITQLHSAHGTGSLLMSDLVSQL